MKIKLTLFYCLTILLCSCSKSENQVDESAQCTTSNLGIISNFKYSQYVPQYGNNIANLSKWQWRQSGDTIVVCGNGFTANGGVAYCFKKNKTCIDFLYRLTSQSTTDTPIITINPDGSTSTAAVVYQTYKISNLIFQKQNYTENINLTGYVGEANLYSGTFWVDFTPDTYHVGKFALENYTIINQ